MTDLTDRYGIRERPRIVVVAVIGALVTGGLALVVWFAWAASTPKVESALIGFEVPEENLATAELLVRRQDEGTPAICLFKAFAEDHTLVGSQQVVVDSGPLQQTLTVRIRTERLATSVSTEGCVTPGQNRPR